ncbi:uncharacterized protein Dwil_GK12396 [Drosophila willistoni]|uniref:Uncharacterized protein n=1 Tax=Drosophila willistoni TaxID=7260 RepID=B4N4L5_DROWI|nr:uncharacterized protein LOC6645468 [Drosophila willistoni]EDW79089.1 uncharacterized protein Dwil_GK12396 [Drosophila willistoni]
MQAQIIPLTLLLLLAVFIQQGDAIWCYRCTSATPGCADHFNWRGIGYLGEQCPEPNDICVKVTERRGAQETITRDCLSALSFRTDIPADKYEGCRPAAVDWHLAHYVNHTIKEHDVKRDYFTNTTFCFCFLDHRCNGASSKSMALGLTMFLASVVAVMLH